MSMNMLKTLTLCWCVSLLQSGSVSHANERESQPPNVVMILADDLGIECLSAYGGRSHQTPHIDTLADQGMRFTRCFSNPTCSPSRATLLTGRYSCQHGVKQVIWREKEHADLYLRTSHPSFARQLQASGYATAIAGKWQLSFLHQRNTIRDLGFDTYQCWQIYDQQLAKTRRFHQPHLIRDGKIIADQIEDRYGPDVNTDFLIDFIQTNAETRKPFLAYYTCLLPHYPWVPTPDSKEKDYELSDTEGIGDPRYFPDMVRYLDKNIGRIMKAIADSAAAENTILIFLADNGTDRRLKNRWGENKTIAGGKGTMTDRGTHVPLIIRWPGKIDPGTTCDDLVDFTDLMPTLCELTGAALPGEIIHGRSFAPQLFGQAGTPRDWVHIQDYEKRHVRNQNYIYTNNGQLRPVVKIWQEPAQPIKQPSSAAERAAMEQLADAFSQIGDCPSTDDAAR